MSGKSDKEANIYETLTTTKGRWMSIITIGTAVMVGITCIITLATLIYMTNKTCMATHGADIEQESEPFKQIDKKSEECLKDFTQWNGKWYVTLSDVKTIFLTARKACRQIKCRYGQVDLPTFETYRELDNVVYKHDLVKGSWYWTGAISLDLDEDTQNWNWIANSNTIDDALWKNSYPKNVHSRGYQQNCAYIRQNDTNLYDVSCNYLAYAICQYMPYE